MSGGRKIRSPAGQPSASPQPKHVQTTVSPTAHRPDGVGLLRQRSVSSRFPSPGHRRVAGVWRLPRRRAVLAAREYVGVDLGATGPGGGSARINETSGGATLNNSSGLVGLRV